MKAPERLLDDSTLEGKLRVDLQVARDNPTGHYDVAAGAEAFRKTLKEGGAQVFPKPPKGGLPSAITGKLFAVGAVGLALGTAGLLSLSREAPRKPVEQLKDVSAPMELESGPTRLPTESTAAPSLGTPAPVAPSPGHAPSLPAPLETSHPSAAHKAPPPVTQAVKSRRAAGGDTIMDEIAHLKKVRTASKTDPAEALRLAQEGHQTFASGLLHEEREGLLILALQELGRREEASKRSERFKTRYPKSALLPQIMAGTRGAPP